MSKTLEFHGVWSLQLPLECPFRTLFDDHGRSSIFSQTKSMLVDVRDGRSYTHLNGEEHEGRAKLPVVVDAEFIECFLHYLPLR